MTTRFQLEMNLIAAGKAYSQLAQQTLSIARQRPSQNSALSDELRELEDERRAALWAYNKIFAELHAEIFDGEPPRAESPKASFVSE